MVTTLNNILIVTSATLILLFTQDSKSFVTASQKNNLRQRKSYLIVREKTQILKNTYRHQLTTGKEVKSDNKDKDKLGGFRKSKSLGPKKGKAQARLLGGLLGGGGGIVTKALGKVLGGGGVGGLLGGGAALGGGAITGALGGLIGGKLSINGQIRTETINGGSIGGSGSTDTCDGGIDGAGTCCNNGKPVPCPVAPPPVEQPIQPSPQPTAPSPNGCGLPNCQPLPPPAVPPTQPLSGCGLPKCQPEPYPPANTLGSAPAQEPTQEVCEACG